MANEQTDSIQILANDIVNTMSSIVSSHSGKASFDKSFPATILGVNQDFVQDISDEKKNELINQFSIPVKVEGDDNYYIVKIGSDFYCMKQAAGYKLYDSVMVYVPNNNWSNMYLDYADSKTDSDNAGDIPNLYVETEPPGGANPDNNSIWLTVSNDNTTFSDIQTDDFVKMFVFREDDKTHITMWQSVVPFIASSTGAIGNKADKGDYWIKTNNQNKFQSINICTVATATERTWSRVYPNSEEGSTPNVIITDKVPTKEGDYWIEITDEEDKNIEAFYKYDIDIEDRKSKWKLLYNVLPPRVFAQPDDPSISDDPDAAIAMRKGDYWIEIDNVDDRKFKNVYRWKINEQTGIGEWDHLCASGGGGGGGDVYINISHAILVQQGDVV